MEWCWKTSKGSLEPHMGDISTSTTNVSQYMLVVGEIAGDSLFNFSTSSSTSWSAVYVIHVYSKTTMFTQSPFFRRFFFRLLYLAYPGTSTGAQPPHVSQAAETFVIINDNVQTRQAEQRPAASSWNELKEQGS